MQETQGCCNHGADHVHDHTELDDRTDERPAVVDPGETRIPVNDDIVVEVTGGEIDPAERDAYLAYARRREGNSLKRLVIHVEGDEVNLEYHCRQDGFQRIRRITGYLVGDISRFNNAKRAEEHDRVKHMAHEATIGQV